jgi:GNAT superfamily N-acetyltransferase
MDSWLSPTQTITTRFPIDLDLTPGTIKRLSDLINQVYDDAESGMWKRKGTRTNPAEVERLLRDRALILAEIDGVVIGSVNVNLMGDGVGEFGMLVADPNCRGTGIGSVLVDRAESWAREMACHTMRLELLTPREWSHPRRQPNLSSACIRSWCPSWQRSATSLCGTSLWGDQGVPHASAQPAHETKEPT